MNEHTIKNKRIWELDVFRGFCILCVIVVHLVFDIQTIFGLLDNMPPLYVFIQEYGGTLFVILSGICVTLGSRNIKRGLIVAGGAVIITAVTVLIFEPELHIWFGILHLLAFCMLTYGIYKKLPPVLTLIIGVTFAITGLYFDKIYVDSPYLFILGLKSRSFSAGDYFPILPYLGFFMIGTFIGKTVYKEKKTLFPRVNESCLLLRFLSWCGRHSFFIYLIHQPVLYGACMLIAASL